MTELGTPEHYQEYLQNCNEAGLIPVSWAEWEIQYPQPAAPVNESAVSAKPEWKTCGFDTEFEWELAQSLGARDQEVVALEAEVKRLTEQNKRFRDGLMVIRYGKEREWLKANPNVKAYDDVSARRVAAIVILDEPLFEEPQK